MIGKSVSDIYSQWLIKLKRVPSCWSVGLRSLSLSHNSNLSKSLIDYKINFLNLQNLYKLTNLYVFSKIICLFKEKSLLLHPIFKSGAFFRTFANSSGQGEIPDRR